MINYTERIALLMHDIVVRTPRLSFIDLREVIVFGRFGRSDAEGAFATCHCMTLPESEPGDNGPNAARFAGGCRARALVLNGSINAPDPWITEKQGLAGRVRVHEPTEVVPLTVRGTRMRQAEAG